MNRAQTPVTAKRILTPRLAAVILAILLLLGIYAVVVPKGTLLSGTGRSDYPLSADAKNVIRVERTTQITIRAECKSAWIQVPPGRHMRLDTPGEVEVWCWNGDHFLSPDKDLKWLNELPSTTFRVRGKSVLATLHIE